MTYLMDCGVEVKTSGMITSSTKPDEQLVRFGNHAVPMSEFCEAVHYVMTNTDLSSPQDPRMKLVEVIRTYRTAPGFNKVDGAVRLECPSGDSLHYPD